MLDEARTNMRIGLKGAGEGCSFPPSNGRETSMIRHYDAGNNAKGAGRVNTEFNIAEPHAMRACNITDMKIPAQAYRGISARLHLYANIAMCVRGNSVTFAIGAYPDLVRIQRKRYAKKKNIKAPSDIVNPTELHAR